MGPARELSADKMTFTSTKTVLVVEVGPYEVHISTKLHRTTHLKRIDGGNGVAQPAAVIVHFCESPKAKDKDSVGLQRE